MLQFTGLGMAPIGSGFMLPTAPPPPPHTSPPMTPKNNLMFRQMISRLAPSAPQSPQSGAMFPMPTTPPLTWPGQPVQPQPTVTVTSGGSTGSQANPVCPDGSMAASDGSCPRMTATVTMTPDGSEPSPGMQLTTPSMASTDTSGNTSTTVTMMCPDGTVLPVIGGIPPMCPIAAPFPWLLVGAVGLGTGLLLAILRK